MNGASLSRAKYDRTTLFGDTYDVAFCQTAHAPRLGKRWPRNDAKLREGLITEALKSEFMPGTKSAKRRTRKLYGLNLGWNGENRNFVRIRT